MARSSKPKVINLREGRNGNGDGYGLADLNGEARRIDEPRRFPLVSTLPRLPVMIPTRSSTITVGSSARAAF